MVSAGLRRPHLERCGLFWSWFTGGMVVRLTTIPISATLELPSDQARTPSAYPGEGLPSKGHRVSRISRNVWPLCCIASAEGGLLLHRTNRTKDWIEGMNTCEKCHIRTVRFPGETCKVCRYQALVEYTMRQDPDMQDWGFAHCDECGASLDDKGDCRNTSCGNSPYVGTDWL